MAAVLEFFHTLVIHLIYSGKQAHIQRLHDVGAVGWQPVEMDLLLVAELQRFHAHVSFLSIQEQDDRKWNFPLHQLNVQELHHFEKSFFRLPSTWTA